ncbi:MAG: hypothetical protein BA066_03885 [Candidatus Korarchaeota archaeon NZ13-K]|nr:MAG: hypothetical protein BA066_03885 [Candidatus Korarchaeota archaeon NZ13-K]
MPWSSPGSGHLQGDRKVSVVMPRRADPLGSHGWAHQLLQAFRQASSVADRRFKLIERLSEESIDLMVRQRQRIVDRIPQFGMNRSFATGMRRGDGIPRYQHEVSRDRGS